MKGVFGMQDVNLWALPEKSESQKEREQFSDAFIEAWKKDNFWDLLNDISACLEKEKIFRTLTRGDSLKSMGHLMRAMDTMLVMYVHILLAGQNEATFERVKKQFKVRKPITPEKPF